MKVIIEHILNNRKDYIIVSLIFVIGIFLGVFFVNKIDQNKINDVITYFTTCIENMKDSQNIARIAIVKSCCIKNISLAIILWFLGTTIIGIPIVLGILTYRGFCLGYTIAMSVVTLGNIKGTIFAIVSLLLHNILLIPAIVAIGVSGLKLYKSIVKDKRKNNIKIEILRHTIFSFLMSLILVVSAIIEGFLTTNFIQIIIKYL